MTPVQWFGAAVLAVYLIIRLGTIHEYIIHTSGFNTHYNYVFAPVLLGLALLGGRVFQVLQTPIGAIFAAFAGWMAVTVVFSFWKAGSLDAFVTFVTSNVTLFLAAACFTAVSAQQRRIATAVVLAVFWFAFMTLHIGNTTAGSNRLTLPFGTYSNPNGVAIHLLVFAPFLFFVILNRRRSSPIFWLALVSLIATLVIVFRTGSRGGLLALSATTVVALFGLPFAKRMAVVLLLLAAIPILLCVIPKSALARYQTLFSNRAEEFPDESFAVDTAIGSAQHRSKLLRTSLRVTFQHPIFGVGPGQFGSFVYAESKLAGVRESDLGTHNGFTQVSGEMGLIGLALYLGTIWLSLRTVRRVRKSLQAFPQLRPLYTMGWCLTLAWTAYAVNSFFAHVAYSLYLPLLAGLSLGLDVAARGELTAIRAREAR